MTIRVPQRLPDPKKRWVSVDGHLITAIYTYFRELDAALRALIGLSNGGLVAVPLPSYAVSGVPTAADHTGSMIYVTDEAGGAVPAFSDGTNWRRVTDRAVIS